MSFSFYYFDTSVNLRHFFLFSLSISSALPKTNTTLNKFFKSPGKEFYALFPWKTHCLHQAARDSRCTINNYRSELKWMGSWKGCDGSCQAACSMWFLTECLPWINDSEQQVVSPKLPKKGEKQGERRIFRMKTSSFNTVISKVSSLASKTRQLVSQLHSNCSEQGERGLGCEARSYWTPSHSHTASRF